MSLLAFLRRFPDDEACWAHLEAVRWPHGPVCPKCGSIDNAHHVGRAYYWRCNACRAKFRVTHGTPLEGTHLPLRTWFTALYLVAAASKGISSVKLGEHLGIGQKTAWFLGQRIRRMMADKDGLLRDIRHRGMQDAQAVTPNPNATPAPGREFSFIEQLIGNFGKFSGKGQGPGGGGGRLCRLGPDLRGRLLHPARPPDLH